MIEPVVRVSEASKRHGSFELWNGVSFEVPASESLAIAGRSGSGKSTLLDCVGLLDRFDSGTISIGGVDVTRIASHRRRRFFRGTVGHLRQDYGVEGSWSVDRNLDLGLIGAGPPARERARLRAEALSFVGLSSAGQRRAGRLSGGEQQRVGLARLLLRRPRLVLADEPTSALDAANADCARLVLERLLGDGAAVIVATHDPALVDWCSRSLDLEDS